VLYICNEYPPAIHGGIGTFVRTLAERLAAARHDVAVLGFASHVRETTLATQNGVRIVRLPWPRGRSAIRLGYLRIDSAGLVARAALSRQAARFAAAFRPDVVESHDWSGPLWTRPWRPMIVRLHGASSALAWSAGGKAGRMLRYFERRNLLLADAIAAPSHFIGRTTGEALRLGGRPFRILHHGVDAHRFRPQESLRQPGEVLFAGTVKKQKGIQELFRAMPRILDEFPQARFTIAGRYPEDSSHPCSPQVLLQGLSANGPASTWAESRTPGERAVPAFGSRGVAGNGRNAALAVAANVRFLGHVPQSDLPDLYSRAAVAVFPSHNEAFGLACIEAMACGTAVVMTVRGSGAELVEHGKSGLLVEPANPGAIAAAVGRLLGDTALRRRLGAAARSRVIENFNLHDTAARNVAFYEQVASRFRTAHSVHA
jgi:glycosyltransferase involved in cell wall biosynthesis